MADPYQTTQDTALVASFEDGERVIHMERGASDDETAKHCQS